MRILAFSDLHEDELALQSLKKISPDFDHVFICGDIARTNQFAEEVLEAFPGAFLIPGNWDNELANRIFSESPQWVHEKRVELENGLNLVGFGYSNITPFGTYGELTEDEIYSRMAKLPIDENTLLMLHTPPKGYFDVSPKGEHAGSSSILKIITQTKPLAAFFGHIHGKHLGVEELGSTMLVKLPAANAMQACSVSIEERKIKAGSVSL
ncbi:hypothetical protein GF318_00110 [Candidatus Micrarchaeota archaeon]|nr:hypothetical protein [Candidatus Micrarchaeota archaeon]